MALDDHGQGGAPQRAKPGPVRTVDGGVIYRKPNQRQPGLTTNILHCQGRGVFSFCLEGLSHYETGITVLSIPL